MSILKARFRPGKISFGLGKTEKTINLGDSADVWINTTYNEAYNVVLANDIPKLKINDSLIKITPITVGTYDIKVVVEEKEKLVEFNSNTIKLTVV